MADTVFLLSPLITRNFDQKTKKHFLSQYRLYNEYVRSNKQFHIFIQENIQDGKIKQQDLAEYLFEDLLYGNQRLIYMYELFSYNKDYHDQTELLQRLQSYYSYVDSLNYNQILFQPYNNDIKELVAVKISLAINSTKIQKIVLIFSEKCTVSNKDGQHSEFSYITVEIDYTKKLLFIKVKPKSRVNEESQKPTELAERYFNKVTKILGLKFDDFKNIHRSTLCNMNIELYQQIYNRMVKTQPEEIDLFIRNTADSIIQKIGIADYDIKVTENNVFNIHDTLQKMVEHVLISNILYESTIEGNLEDVDGFVTYIKFSDGTNISARLRSEQYIEPIFASEAFMALRSSIENSKQISELKIYWLNKFSGLRVSYNAMDSQCLEILLYKHHNKGEFEYAVSQYKECEYRTIKQTSNLFAMEA